MKCAPSTDGELGVVLSLNHHFFSDWQCWSYISTSMFWQPQDSRVPHQTYKLGAPHLSLCNYHYILHHFHFSLTDFVYVRTVHCHSAITEHISSIATYESNFLQSSTSPLSALKSSWLGNQQYVFFDSVQLIRALLHFYCIKSWHYLHKPASKAANINPKLSLQNGAGENLKLRKLKPRNFTHYL